MTRPHGAARPFVLCVLALILVLALVSGCGKKKAPPKQESLLDKLPRKEAVIKIDGHEISGAWLRNWCVTEYIRLQRLSGGTPLKVDEYSLIQGGMDLLGKMYVLALEGERRGLTVSPEEVQAALSKEAQRYESTAAWQQTLEKSGLTIDDRKEQIRVDLLFNKFREQVVVPDVQARYVTDDMARQYYDKFPDLFQMPRQVHVLHIARAIGKDATLEQKAKDRTAVEDARKRVTAGEKFEDVAREVSTEATAMKGGDVGWVTPDTPIQAQLKPAVLALKAGEVSQVLEGDTAYHLFKAVEVKEPGKKPFDEAKDDIKKRLLEKGLELEMNKAAGQLRAKLIAEKKYQVLDLVQVLGPPPPEPAAAPAQAQAGGAAPAPAPAPGPAPGAPAAAN